MLQRLPIVNIIGLQWPKTIEQRAAIRTACAALFAIIIAFYFHLQTPYWSGMTAVVVSNLYTGSIIDKALMRILGTILGAFVGFFLAGYVVNSLLLYFLSCFLVIALSVYYYQVSRYGYAYLLGAMCVFLVIAQLAMDPHQAFYVAIWRPVEIGLGVIVATMCAYTIFPNHIQEMLPKEIEGMVELYSQELTNLQQQINSGQQAFSNILDINLTLKKKIRKIYDLFPALKREIGVGQISLDELRAFLDVLYHLSRQTQFLLLSCPSDEALLGLNMPELDDVFSAIKDDLLCVQQQLLHQKHRGAWQAKLPNLVDKLNKNSNWVSEIGTELSYRQIFLNYLSELNTSLVTLKGAFSQNGPAEIPKQRFELNDDRLHGDIDLVKHAIKAGLAVILALSFWMISSWPGGLNGIISSLILSARKNLFEMRQYSIHRVIGCFLGGAVALGSLALIEYNLFDLCCIVFLSVWAFSYFMFRFNQYNYIGLQANIALIISLAQEGGPPTELAPVLERLAGIFIGISATFLVANLLWRQDTLSVLNRYIAKLNRYLLDNLKSLCNETRPAKLHDVASLFWNSRGLIETLSNQSLKRAGVEKLSALRMRFDSLVMQQAILSHIAATTDRQAIVTDIPECNGLLKKLEMNIIELYATHPQASDTELKNSTLVIYQELVQLKTTADKSNLLSYLNALKQLVVIA